jgi:predicted GNAT family N-acyltransferase
MKIYKLSSRNIYVEKRQLSDRTRWILCEETNGEKIEKGKLTIQSNLSDNFYILTSFQISQDLRGQGWGKKMLQEALNEPTLKDKNILVRPEPYVGDDEKDYENLKEMYMHFGFKEAEEAILSGYLIFENI